MQALKALVIVMGIAILAILGVIVATVVQRAGSGPSEQATARFGELAVPVPQGCTIAGAELAGQRLVLRLEGLAERGCQQVVVLDLESGEVLGRVTATPAP